MKNPFIWPQNVSNEHEEVNIVEQQQSQGIINSSQAEEREMYIDLPEVLVHNVKPWKTFIGVQYRILRRVA